jgi:hypothetical protein
MAGHVYSMAPYRLLTLALRQPIAYPALPDTLPEPNLPFGLVLLSRPFFYLHRHDILMYAYRDELSEYYARNHQWAKIFYCFSILNQSRPISTKHDLLLAD